MYNRAALNRVNWMKVSQTPDEMALYSGGFLPTLILGVACISMAVGGYVTYIFYSSAIFQTLDVSLAISPSTSQTVGISLLTFFLLIGFLLIVFDSKTTMVISKRSGQILFGTRKLLVGVKTEKVYNISDIEQIELREESKMEKVTEYGPWPWPGMAAILILLQPLKKTRPVLYRESAIVFKDGEELLLSQTRTLGSITLDTNGMPSFATQVASFLGVPLKQTSRGASMTDTGVSDQKTKL